MTTPTSEVIRLVIADDHAVLRAGLGHIFSNQKDFLLLAAVADGNQLLAAAREHKPDVVISDLKMPNTNGRDACLSILKEFPDTGIITYSMYDCEDLILFMKGIGVRGYLLKGDDSEELCRAVRIVHAGGEFYSASIQKRMTQFFKSGKLGPGLAEKKSKFSKTELDIIELICSEHSSKQIADRLKIKERTIQFHKENIEEKMGVRSVVGIAVYATANWLFY